MAAISIIQRRFYALSAGLAICFGIGWRFGSEQGGDFNRNGVAICSGIRTIGQWFLIKCNTPRITDRDPVAVFT
jgi:hypothetical protein